MSNATNEKACGFDPIGFHNDTTNDLIFAAAQRDGKAFANLAARFARPGCALTRGNPADEVVLYYAGRWGLSCTLHEVDVAAQFLTQIEESV